MSLLCAAMLASCASWSPRDQALMAVNVGCNAVDAAQTSAAMHDGMREGNPLYGSHPTDATIAAGKFAGLGLETLVADKLMRPEHRFEGIVVMTAACVAVVLHNEHAGARL